MSEPQSHIISIGTAVPRYRYEQAAIGDFMIRYFNLEGDEARKISLIYHKSGIEHRHSVLHDFSMNGKVPDLFQNPVTNPSLTSRLDIFRNEAVKISKSAIEDCLSSFTNKERRKLLPVTHLITVSCTGMSAPGLDLELMQEMELPGDLKRTSINFMGCYAGFHAFKLADSICRSETDAVVLVVMTELCSLHFQPDFTTENIVVNSLFADGSAAVLFSSGKKSKKLKRETLVVDGFHSEVIHSAEKLMTWNPSEQGFLMGLDALVPQVIEENAGKLVDRALSRFNTEKTAIRHWIMHPGGRKILEAAEKSIGLEKDELKHSYRVLRDFGNMSSPSVSFALKSLWRESLKGKKKEKIFAAGFGPGITVETALLHPVSA